jgi:cyclophilin family peptidyl-prolyl cis-trans isomerase
VLKTAVLLVLLETSAGDMILRVERQAAPKQAARFAELVERGAYDSVAVERVDPTLYVRFGPVKRRRLPLTPAQLEMVERPRPAVETGLKHEYGVVTIARAPGDDDLSGTGLAFMTASVPPMDGKFASFAVVERGEKVLEFLRGVPCGPGHAPIERGEISRASLITPEAARTMTLKEPPARKGFDWRPGVLALLAGLALFVFSRRRKPRAAALLTILVGFFVVLAALAEGARASAWLGTALFLGAIGVFRLMATFESSA